MSAMRRRAEEPVPESALAQSSGSSGPDVLVAEGEPLAGGQGGQGEDDDMPIPTAEEAREKRGREVDEEESERPSAWMRVEHLDPPDDVEAGLLVAPKVLMLGERRAAPPGHCGR